MLSLPLIILYFLLCIIPIIILSTFMCQETIVDGGGSGSLQGISYFSCPDGRGLFLKLSQVRKDARFHEVATSGDTLATEEVASKTTTGVSTSTPDPLDPFSDLLSKLALMGETKGKISSSINLSQMWANYNFWQNSWVVYLV